MFVVFLVMNEAIAERQDQIPCISHTVFGGFRNTQFQYAADVIREVAKRPEKQVIVIREYF